jgi:uncharacterized membrane protein
MDQTLETPINKSKEIISISELFSKSFAVYQTLFFKVIGIELLALLGLLPLVLVLILFAIFEAISLDSATANNIVNIILALLMFVGFIFFIAISIISQVGAMNIIKDNNKDIKIFDAFKAARPQASDYFTTTLLGGILIMLWTLLLVVPGIIMMVFYSFIAWVVIVEGFTGMKALRRSKDLVKGHWWQVALRLLLPNVILYLVSFIPVIGGLISFVASPFLIAYSYNIYKSLVDLKAQSLNNQ